MNATRAIDVHQYVYITLVYVQFEAKCDIERLQVYNQPTREIISALRRHTNT